jgi:hypothetical protein
MAQAKIEKQNGKTVLVLPDEIAHKFRGRPNGTVYVRETSRGIEVTSFSHSEDYDIRHAQEKERAYRRNWRFAGG